MFHADATPHPRLAFSISRAVGNAVVRNRARRQLRALFAELARQRSDLLSPGDYLVGVRAAPFDTGEARTWLTQALEELAGP